MACFFLWRDRADTQQRLKNDNGNETLKGTFLLFSAKNALHSIGQRLEVDNSTFLEVGICLFFTQAMGSPTFNGREQCISLAKVVKKAGLIATKAEVLKEETVQKLNVEHPAVTGAVVARLSAQAKVAVAAKEANRLKKVEKTRAKNAARMAKKQEGKTSVEERKSGQTKTTGEDATEEEQDEATMPREMD